MAKGIPNHDGIQMIPPIDESYTHDPSDFDESYMLEPKKRNPVQCGLLRAKRVCANTAVHIAPVAITIGTLTLTFKQKFWTNVSTDTNTILNLLQFAAQLHGSLMVMSLSAILLHVVSRGLRSSSGIPHGHLTSSFQLNSLSYLLRSQSWSALKQTRHADFRYVVFFLSMFMLAFACQPSSAIAMIPRLQFWMVSDIYPGNSVQYKAYIQATPATLFPTILSADSVLSNCSQANASIAASCPSRGIREILAQDSLFAMGDNQALIVGIELPYYRGIHSTYIAHTLANFFGTALNSWTSLLFYFGNPLTNTANIQRDGTDLKARYDLSLLSGGSKIPAKKPTVQVECAGYLPNASEITFPIEYRPFDVRPSSISSSQFEGLLADQDAEAVNFKWIDIRQFSNPTPSLFALSGVPTIYTPSSVQYGASSSNPNDTFSMIGCTFYAGWESADVFEDNSAGGAAIYDFTPSGEDDRGIVDYVQIYTGFADYLNVPYFEGGITPVSTNKSIMQVIGEKCVSSNTAVNETILGLLFPGNGTHHMTDNPMKILFCFQMSLSVYLVDAISRIQDSIPAYFVASGHLKDEYATHRDLFYVQSLYDDFGINNLDIGDDNFENIYHGLTQDDFDDASKFTEISMPLSRYGYGYGFAGSKLIYVAVVILLIHVAVCVIHITWIAVTDPHVDLGWDTVGELVAELLRSPNAGRGVPLLKTNRKWKDRIVVIEQGDDEKTLRAMAL